MIRRGMMVGREIEPRDQGWRLRVEWRGVGHSGRGAVSKMAQCLEDVLTI